MSQGNEPIELVTQQVQEVVKRFVEKSSIKNYQTSIVPGTVRGDNFLGIIANVVVTGKDEKGKSKELNLIVKSAPRNDAFRQYMAIRTLYEREIYIYSKVFPEFAKIQAERGVLKPFNSLAKYHTSTMAEKNEALIMENMKAKGFHLKNRLQPLNYEHVLFVLKEYGKLHALSFALRDQKPELFQELLDNSEDTFFQTFSRTENQINIEKNIDLALNALDPIKDKIACNKLKGIQDTLLTDIEKIAGSKMAGKHAVIAHGDSWTNNILFKYDGQNVSDICILDWQLVRACSPVLDIAYLIFTCTDHDLRDKSYHQLLQEYYNSLSSFLRELGSDPEKLFPFSVFQEHVKTFSLFGLYMALMILYLTTSDAEDMPDTNSFECADEATDQFYYKSRNIEIFNARMSGVVRDFIKFGYL